MRNLARILLMLAIGAGTPRAHAADEPETGYWRSAATQDLKAAHRLILENHPAAAPSVADEVFLRRLEAAYRTGMARAAQVRDHGSYQSTLSAFAVALKDRHLRFRPAYVAARLEWPGIIVGKRGGRWRVVHDEGVPGLIGAELIACDGVGVQDLGRRSLGVFKVDWDVPAQQQQAAPWLLVDEGLGGWRKPGTCTFRKEDGTEEDIHLQWKSARREDIVPKLEEAVGTGAAGMGVRRAGDGIWISLQELSPRANDVLRDVRQAMESSAPRFAVVDLRGNGGGSSAFGRMLANILWGSSYVDGVLGPESADCASVWRVSELNIATLRRYVDTFGNSRGGGIRSLLLSLLSHAEAAERRGDDLTGTTQCAAVEKDDGNAPGHPMDPIPVVVLTDARCFSSCLIVVDDFRRLGATQAGQPTDAATRYTEVLDVPLPSGLGTFSTLQGFDPNAKPSLGPFIPALMFDGDISDTAAVEAWILEKRS